MVICNFCGLDGDMTTHHLVAQKYQGNNEPPNMIALNSFKALNLLYEAIQRVGQDPIKIKEYFDKNGDTQQKVYIKTIREGRFVIVNV